MSASNIRCNNISDGETTVGRWAVKGGILYVQNDEGFVERAIPNESENHADLALRVLQRMASKAK
jgi:hypothetical protein